MVKYPEEEWAESLQLLSRRAPAQLRGNIVHIHCPQTVKSHVAVTLFIKVLQQDSADEVCYRITQLEET
jgi:hypothetical protein